MTLKFHFNPHILLIVDRDCLPHIMPSSFKLTSTCVTLSFVLPVVSKLDSALRLFFSLVNIARLVWLPFQISHCHQSNFILLFKSFISSSISYNILCNELHSHIFYSFRFLVNISSTSTDIVSSIIAISTLQSLLELCNCSSLKFPIA